MDWLTSLDQLRAHGKMTWEQRAAGWVAEPDEVVGALSREGFEEVKREVARRPRAAAAGGVWQGLNPRTGAVASAIWVNPISGQPLCFIDIDGNPVTG